MAPIALASSCHTRCWSRPAAAAAALTLWPCLLSAGAAVDLEASERQPPCSRAERDSGLDLACLVQRELSIERTDLTPRSDQLPGFDGRQWLSKEPQQPAPGEPQDSAEPQDQGPDKTQAGDPSVLQAAGVGRNSEGDLGVFVGALISNSFVLTACATFFSLARRWFPQVYANNVRPVEEGGFATAPFTPSDGFFGWIPAGLSVTVEQVKACSGLDAALLLEYASFSMKLLAVVGVPLLLVLSPLHYWCGGLTKDSDHLSSIGLNNIEHGSWLFIFHAFVVWYVVLATERMVFSSMKRFLNLRFQWLEALAPPRSTTVLVEGLPERLQSDKSLAEHFGRYFPHEAVESAYVVKYIGNLKPMVKELKAKKLALEKANFKKAKNEKLLRGAGGDGGDMSSTTPVRNREKLEAEVQQLKATCLELEMEVAGLERDTQAERARILEAAGTPFEEEQDAEGDGKKALVLSEKAREVCAPSGFVTFANEREALLAMSARCSADAEDMVLSIPPSPTDIRYDDLAVSPAWQSVKTFLGYGAIFGIFCSYTPFIVAISTLTQLDNLEKLHAFHTLMEKAPTIATLVQGFFSTLGIVTFMSLLPTILMWIFRRFFTLKADAWSQLQLQIVYFWFLFVFVLLITAVGGSLLGRVAYLMKHPMETSGVLADSLPTATHFYLNYVIMQWVVHAMNLTRYIQLGKFCLFRAAVGEERAVQLAEPEDQDYYGYGARSARWSLDLLLAIVFCSITPLMTVVAFLNFLITRVVYGYLLTFAEKRKHDLGGPFFVEQMKHVQFGLIVYVLLMMGVFARRAATWLPVYVAGFALLPVLCACRRLYSVAWETLTLDYVTSDDFQKRSKERNAAYRGQGAQQARYMQPELSEEALGSST